MGRFQPGIYSINLRAQNDISVASTNITIYVQYSIMDAHVSVPNTVQGFPTRINITLNGTYLFFVDIDFGDNSSVWLSSVNLDPQTLKRTPQDYGPPFHIVYVSHVYSDIGIYDVHFNISNHVSYILASSTAVVEEPITGIALDTNSTHMVRLLENVVVRATVETGKNLRFRWDFGDPYIENVQRYVGRRG